MDGARKAGVAEHDWREWHGFQCLRIKTIIDTDFSNCLMSTACKGQWKLK